MTRKLFYLFAIVAMAFSGCGDPDDPKNPDDPENPVTPGNSVEINGVVWATRNIGESGKFVKNVEDYGYYYTFDEAQTVCPEGWRTPTREEFESLIRSGNEWTTQNGVNGRMFGIANGRNKMFVPAAGFIGTDGQFSGQGSNGNFWSSTTYYSSGDAYYDRLYFNSGGVGMGNIYSRTYGCSVRCVAQ